MSLYWVLYFDRKLDVCLLFSGCIYFGQLVMQGEIIVLIEIGQVQSSHLLTIDEDQDFQMLQSNIFIFVNGYSKHFAYAAAVEHF